MLSVVPRYAVTVGSLKVTQRGNGGMGATRLATHPVNVLQPKRTRRIALQTPKSKHVRKGDIAFRVLNIQLL